MGSPMYAGLEAFAENLVSHPVTEAFPRASLLDVFISFPENNLVIKWQFDETQHII